MNGKIIEYIENSFLKDLLKEDSITDISYNGETIYYKDNIKGRLKSDITITKEDAYAFIRQIANLTDSPFSYVDPILDVSVDKYRINATHTSISRKNREKAINFAIRIGYNQLRIKENDGFIPLKALTLLDYALRSKNSIVISGKTGTGKTEFQKFLISRLEPSSRIITIDNINELETDFFSKDLDSQTWLVLPKNKEYDIEILIKNALRSTPDWLIIGEVRGKEMLPLLNSAMSGHPTITTLHSKNIENTYNRMARMAMINSDALKYDETLIDIFDHFKVLIHLNVEYNFNKKMYVRYVDSIGTNVKGIYYELFKYPNKYSKIPPALKEELELTQEEYSQYNQEIKKEKI